MAINNELEESIPSKSLFEHYTTEPTKLNLNMHVETNTRMLNIIIDLNGLLLKQCYQPSPSHLSIMYNRHKYIVLRPGCLEFLDSLFNSCNVAIWSIIQEHVITSIVKALEKFVGHRLPFFAIWNQNDCYKYGEKIIYRPGRLGVEAMFKPIAKFSMLFGCDSSRTILIDNDPFNGCVNPQNNCIYPYTFDFEKKVDNTLICELLPYLFKLNEVDDVRDIIGVDRYGQPPMSENDKFYDNTEVVRMAWQEENKIWSRKMFDTRRLPSINGLEESKSNKNDHHMLEILQAESTNLRGMKRRQLTSLAKKLGWSKLQGSTLDSAKCYLENLYRRYNIPY